MAAVRTAVDRPSVFSTIVMVVWRRGTKLDAVAARDPTEDSLFAFGIFKIQTGAYKI